MVSTGKTGGHLRDYIIGGCRRNLQVASLVSFKSRAIYLQSVSHVFLLRVPVLLFRLLRRSRTSNEPSTVSCIRRNRTKLQAMASSLSKCTIHHLLRRYFGRRHPPLDRASRFVILISLQYRRRWAGRTCRKSYSTGRKPA